MIFNDVGVVIPAYNESKNLRILLLKIYELYPGISVFVVDDSSQKEKKELKLLERLFKKKKLYILYRNKKSGRGSAVRDGMRALLLNKKIKYFIEMDADLAHRPEEINLFIKEKNTADLIIGSRYLKESRIIKWPMRRIIQSKIINIFLKLWLGINISDYTNGFRLYSRRAVEKLLRFSLREKGFIALSEMAYKLKRAKFTIKEIPTTFTDRKYGQSNANTKELLISFIGAIRIRFGTN
ncbi:MAG: glycosyltransferase [Patescibacteria group bacterium]|nr:glycosyltransferase [Actinomycetota bacterium]MCL5438504.1 glycosyltransferase [Patescibacteria group bacterium]